MLKTSTSLDVMVRVKVNILTPSLRTIDVSMKIINVNASRDKPMGLSSVK